MQRRGRFSLLSWLCLVGLLTAAPHHARAEELTVAVAANFLGTMEKLAPLFEKSTGHKLRLSPGASGQLYAQIKAGAPYDVLLSADAERPLQLAREGLAVAATRVVYAQGKLVLWSTRANFVDDKGAVLKRADLSKVALADPETAPYGLAARQVLEKLGVWQKLRSAGKLVLGASVAQAHQFVESGSASCGFVALAQLLAGKQRGSSWHIPQTLHVPLHQEAIVLKSNRPAARKLLAWLKSDGEALRIIRAAGYRTSAALARAEPR